MPAAVRAIINTFRYPRSPIPNLSAIDLTVEQGEFVIVTGPAGAGKTTLCYCLSGAIPKTIHGEFDGTVEIQGIDIATLALPEVSRLLGFVLQTPENQLFSIRVEEDVAFGPENLQFSRDDVQDRVHYSLEFTGAAHLQDRFSHLLSGGETQRVVLASILAMNPDVYVFDQPAAELDPAGRRTIYENIRRLNRDAGKTIILVEDRLSDVVAYADRIILLDQGKVIRDASPPAFFADLEPEHYGVRVPDAIRLYHELRVGGLALPSVPITVDEVVDAIQTELPDKTHSPVVAESPNSLSKESTAETPAIDISELTYRYPAGVEALSGVTLRVSAGEFLAVVGPNGAGKTTLVKHIVGLLRPTAGTVRILGNDIGDIPVHEISDWVGFLFQDPDYQVFNNSCLEEVAYSLKLRNMPEEQVHEQAMAALTRLGLAEYADEHPYTLSRGQRQRLAVASAFALRPPILVVDEPSTGLDYRETLSMMELLEEYRRQGGTVVVVTHDMEMAVQFARRIVVIARGAIAYDSPADRMAEHFDELRPFAIMLPDVAAIGRKLSLPVHVQTVSDVATVLLRRRAGGKEVYPQ